MQGAKDIKKLLELLKTPALKIQGCILNLTTENITYALLILIVIVILMILKCIFKKTIKNFINTKENLNYSTEILKEFGRANLLTIKDFVLLPENLRNFTELLEFSLKSGQALMFPDDLFKRYFGETKHIELKSKNYSEQEGLKVEVKEILFLADESSTVLIKIRNTSSENQNIVMGVGKTSLKKWIKLKLNNEFDLEVEDISEKECFKNKTLEPNEFITSYIYFKTLDRGQIREIKSIELCLELKKSKRIKYKEAIIPIEDVSNKKDFKNLVLNKFDIESTMLFLTFGGYLLIITPVLLFLIISGAMLGKWILILNTILAIFLTILALNLNSKFAQVLLDLLKENGFKGKNI